MPFGFEGAWVPCYRVATIQSFKNMEITGIEDIFSGRRTQIA
jgi:hypothetical protein